VASDNKAQKPRPIQRAEISIGEDLRTWRLLQRLTVQQVADRAGISGRTVRRLEDGEGASLESVLRVARALGLLEQLAAALDPYESDVGRLRADESLPLRVRSRGSEKR
jgi:transcriptional regulator with XRE-family HTH domain